MNRVITYISLIIFLTVSCVPTFDEEGELPNNPGIKEILIGNENGKIPQQNAIHPDLLIDTVWVKDKAVDFSNVYLHANLEAGCVVEPLDGAPKLGTYGNFSTPMKYRINAPGGSSADWLIVLDYYIPPVGCLADRWIGNLTCVDEIYLSYSPASCTGVKLNNNCQQLKITFDFWGDAAAITEMELRLEDIDTNTFTGKVTLVEDVTVTSYGSKVTFHKGDAGTYNAIANELHLAFEFSGYDIGGGKYLFTIKQNS